MCRIPIVELQALCDSDEQRDSDPERDYRDLADHDDQRTGGVRARLRQAPASLEHDRLSTAGSLTSSLGAANGVLAGS